MKYEDYMSVELTGITMPRMEGVTTPGQLLAHHARVSNTGNQMNHVSGPALLRSLIRRKEWSPFEMVAISMEIKTTRDIGRQQLRHGKAFGFQEFSQRYAVVEEPIILKEARSQHPTDRQMSVPIDDPELKDWWEQRQMSINRQARDTYIQAMGKGIAREVARSVLPEGNTPSTLYIAGWLRSWIHYIGLRGKEATQKEHRMIAERALPIITQEFPDLRSTLAKYYEGN